MGIVRFDVAPTPFCEVKVTAAVELDNPWNQIKQILASKISSQAYQNWVMRTQFESLEAGEMRISVPDKVTKEWMEQEYAEDIRTAARELGLRVDSIVYIPRLTFDAGC